MLKKHTAVYIKDTDQPFEGMVEAILPDGRIGFRRWGAERYAWFFTTEAEAMEFWTEHGHNPVAWPVTPEVAPPVAEWADPNPPWAYQVEPGGRTVIQEKRGKSRKRSRDED